MDRWKELIKSTEHWGIEDMAITLAEAKIAAVAYIKSMVPIVGIDLPMALNEVAEIVLDPQYDEELQECWMDEFGVTKDEPIAVTLPLKESLLMQLYTADSTEREEFWAIVVTFLICKNGYSEDSAKCEREARRQLYRARYEVTGGCI